MVPSLSMRYYLSLTLSPKRSPAPPVAVQGCGTLESIVNEIEWLPWKFSLFQGGFTTVQPYSITVKEGSQLDKMFLDPPWRHQDFPKKKLPCWSPALYKKGATRANGNVASISTVVFDYDHPRWSAETMHQHLRELGLAFALYTTWSHVDEEPRYRVVLFLSRPLSRSEFTKVREAALDLIDYKEGVDTGCSDLARHYAMPIRRTGSSFQGYLDVSFPPLCVDSLMTETKEAQEPSETGVSDALLVPSLILTVSEDGRDKVSVEDLLSLGPGKHKCACPFQEDASYGSAFLRVMNDGRAFLMCTSERHDHEKSQFWLKGKEGKKSEGKGSGRAAAHSVAKRRELLEEIPDKLRTYVDANIVFNAPQNVFYRRDRGAWQVGSPLRKDGIFNHLIGKLTEGLDGRHVNALVDHILSRQVYGFTCDSSRGPIIYEDGAGPQLNLYARPELKPLDGDCDRIKQIMDILCGGEEKAIEWLKHWSASLIQHPERRSMVAVLSMSPQQGIGKSMFGRVLSTIIGERNSAIVSNRALRDSFNASYVTRLLVLADEVAVSGVRDSDAVIPALKAYITDDRIPCRAPYAARTEVENRMTWWLTSNDRRPLMLEKDDRRFTVLMPKACDWEYRKMLSTCFNSKTGRYSKSFALEIRAFAAELHKLQVNYRLIAKPYAAPARALLQEASRGSVDHFADLIQEVGVAAALSDYPPGPDYISLKGADVALGRGIVSCELLYGSYRTWSERNGRRDIRPESTLRLGMLGNKGTDVQWVQSGGRRFQAYTGLQVSKKEENVIQMPGAADPN